jgi:hypothetical protein
LIPLIPVTVIKIVPMTKNEIRRIKENFKKKIKYFIKLTNAIPAE